MLDIHTPNKTRQLTESGVRAQEHYLNLGLELLHKHGTLRIGTLAFALFPNRPQKAAIAASYRVIANATARGFVDFVDEKKTRYRYYALARRGARYLREQGRVATAEPTTALLNKPTTRKPNLDREMAKAHHREWTNMCAIAASLRGMKAHAERDYWNSKVRGDIDHYIGHAPDALTFFHTEEGAFLMWHEFELSRRSVHEPRRTIDGAPVLSGRDKLRNLLVCLREKRFVCGTDKRAWTVALMLHCASHQIIRDLLRILSDVFSGELIEGDRYARLAGSTIENDYIHMRVQFKNLVINEPEFLEIFLEKLPHEGAIGRVWHDSCDLPWFEVGASLDTKFNEQFVRTVSGP